jgi:hypothetical protein
MTYPYLLVHIARFSVLMRFVRWGDRWTLRIAAISDRKLGASMSGMLSSAPVKETGDFDLDALVARITIEDRHEEI